MSNDKGLDKAPNRDQRFEQIVTQHQKSVLHICYLYLCDKTLAEDATQETFLKVYQKLDSFRGESSERTWIMKIAMHTCYDTNHSSWFRFFNRKITPDLMPDETAQPNEIGRELTIAVTMLPLKLREVILLYYFQGMKVNDIAEVLNITQPAVSGRLKRGRERLKNMLEGRELDE